MDTGRILEIVAAVGGLALIAALAGAWMVLRRLRRGRRRGGLRAAPAPRPSA